MDEQDKKILDAMIACYGDTQECWCENCPYGAQDRDCVKLEQRMIDLVQRQAKRIDALEHNLFDGQNIDGDKLFPCDPAKNDGCAKYGCHINGGPCYLTTDKSCADRQ